MYNTKNHVLIRDIISKFHPDFITNYPLSAWALANPQKLNIEGLIEETLAAVGGYDFVDEDGYDFNDSCQSDSKTTSVNIKTRVVEVKNIESKIGALRITVFNPLKDSVDFMFIPSDDRVKLARACYGTSMFKQRLQMNWNSDCDHYNMFEQFRMPTFKDMARADYQDWTQRKLGLIPN
jgi:hypothetical protein